jgi:hypothetical protein
MKELERCGLIEQRRTAGSPNKIFLKNVLAAEIGEPDAEHAPETAEQAPEPQAQGYHENQGAPDDGQTDHPENHGGSTMKFTGVPPRKSGPKYISLYIPQDNILSGADVENRPGGIGERGERGTRKPESASMTYMRQLATAETYFREELDLEGIEAARPDDVQLVGRIAQLLAETITTQRRVQLVGGQLIPTEQVRERLLQLGEEDVEQVLDGLKNSAKAPRNMKQYLLAALYNAPLNTAAKRYAACGY